MKKDSIKKQGKEPYYGEGVETVMWQILIPKDRQVEIKEEINEVRKKYKR